MDENGVKTLKDEFGPVNLNFLSHFRLERQTLHFKARNPGLEFNGVATHVDKHGRTPLNYILCIVEAFKRIKKGTSDYRIIPFRKSLWEDKHKKKNGEKVQYLTPQGYINKVTELLSSCTIPMNSSDIFHRIILGKIARLRLSCDSYFTATESTKLNNYFMLLYYN